MILTEILDALADVYTPVQVATWLMRPHQMLGGRTPQAMINAGLAAEVLAVVNQLRDCSYT